MKFEDKVDKVVKGGTHVLYGCGDLTSHGV